MTNEVRSGNGYGIAGFVLAIISVVLAFIKVNSTFVAGWEWIVYAVWCIAAVVCTIGLFRRPRVLAAIGLAIILFLLCYSYFVTETVTNV